jgi:glycosyl transferase family 25
LRQFAAVLTFVINLARRSDRLAVMSAQLEKLSIDFERFDAFDGSSLRLPPDATLTAAETACHRSHRACWQKLLDSNEDFAVILEDDLVISPRLAGFLAAPERWPGDADVIRLETYRQLAYLSTRFVTASAGIRLHRLLTEQYGAGGYVISRTCAERLLGEIQPARVPVDVMIYAKAKPGADGLCIYQAVPALCIQGKVYYSEAVPETMISDIEPMRRLRYAMLEALEPLPAPEPPATGFARVVEEAKRIGRPLYRSWMFGDRQHLVEFDKSGDPAAGAISGERYA